MTLQSKQSVTISFSQCVSMSLFAHWLFLRRFPPCPLDAMLPNSPTREANKIWKCLSSLSFQEYTGRAKIVPLKRGRSVAERAAAGSLWKTAVCRQQKKEKKNQLQVTHQGWTTYCGAAAAFHIKTYLFNMKDNSGPVRLRKHLWTEHTHSFLIQWTPIWTHPSITTLPTCSPLLNSHCRWCQDSPAETNNTQ